MEAHKRVALVVEDDDGLRKALLFEFKRKGFEVLEASGANAALAIIRDHEIDIITTDLRMPEGDGVALLKGLKELASSQKRIPPVILMTGFSEISIEEAYDLGAIAVFSKPFDRKALFLLIENALMNLDSKWKRKTERVDVDLKIMFTLAGEHDFRQKELLNVGQGGFFLVLAATELPPVNSRIEFKISFKSPLKPVTMEGTGVVRWSRHEPVESKPVGCGIEFSDLSDQCRSDVIELVNALKTRAYIPQS